MFVPLLRQGIFLHNKIWYNGKSDLEGENVYYFIDFRCDMLRVLFKHCPLGGARDKFLFYMAAFGPCSDHTGSPLKKRNLGRPYACLVPQGFYGTGVSGMCGVSGNGVVFFRRGPRGLTIWWCWVPR